MTTRLVGSAATEVKYAKRIIKRANPIQTRLIDPLRRHAPIRAEDEEYIPPTDGFLEQLIREDRRRKRNRIIAWALAACLLAAAVLGAGALAYGWTQEQYYVGTANEHVAIYQGVQQNVGPFELSHLVEESDLAVDELSPYQRDQVEQTINAGSLEDAQQLVQRLRESS